MIVRQDEDANAYLGNLFFRMRLLRNLLDRLTFIVMFCILIGDLRGAKVASFDKLRELSHTHLAKGMRLKEIVTINRYADFKNGSAYHLVSMEVINLLKEHHPTDTATILALESGHFLAAAYTDPNFSNPKLMVGYVWRAAAIWQQQEMYIKHVAKVDSPSDCLPSHQFRRAIEHAAAVATNYALTYHLYKQDWSKFTLCEINNDVLEGVH